MKFGENGRHDKTLCEAQIVTPHISSSHSLIGAVVKTINGLFLKRGFLLLSLSINATFFSLALYVINRSLTWKLHFSTKPGKEPLEFFIGLCWTQLLVFLLWWHHCGHISEGWEKQVCFFIVEIMKFICFTPFRFCTFSLGLIVNKY